MKSLRLVVLLWLFGTPALAPAQVKAPPPPADYLIDIRYEIDAFANERSAQFKEMVDYLKANGFVRSREDMEDGREKNEEIDRQVNRMRGTIPSDKVNKILIEPHIVTVKLVPKTAPLPAADQFVRVDLTLVAGVNSDRQRQLAREIVAVLTQMQFKEGVGYDHRNHTRILGSLPVAQLEPLLTDLRRTPASLNLLPISLLNEVRGYREGEAMLKAVLPSWWQSEEGKKFIAPLIADWRKEAPAIRYIRNLPVEVVRLKDVVDDELFEQMIAHPDAGPYLERMMAGVLKSPAANALLEPLLRRMRGRAVAAVLPPLYRPRTLLRIVEVRPDLPLPAVRPAEVKVPDAQRKLSPEVRALLADPAQAAQLRRMEILLGAVPDGEERTWSRPLEQVAPELQIEGRVGALVSGLLSAKSALALVPLTQVSTIRLPRTAHSTVLTLSEDAATTAAALKATGLDRAHNRGHKGKKIRLAVIDSDFRGWKAEVGKRLPAGTRYVDLTLERNVDFVPDPFPGAATELGSGTQMALAALAAAPEVELTLIRVDAGAPHLVGLAARRIVGQGFETEALRRRAEEMNLSRVILNTRRKELNTLRRQIFDKFPDNRPGADKFILERQKELDAYEKQEAQFKVEVAEHLARTTRLLNYREELEALQNVRVVVCGLTWNDGHPVNGTSGLTQLLDELAEADRLWFQATGPLPGQVWSGLYRDPDGNGRMNFIADGGKQAAGTWDAETNFLAWKGRDGKRLGEVPAGTRLRVSVQWSEAHDADFGKLGDPYREPLTKLRLVVLKQLDPSGTKQPSDDLVFVKESEALPQRLRQDATSATYEHSIEFTTEAGVRYVLSLEGVPASGTVPALFPTPPIGGRVGEVRPRILVDSLLTTGEPILDSYATESGSLGSPADALRLFTVGAADNEGKLRSYSGRGLPYQVEMVTRPEVIAPDRLGLAGMTGAGGPGISAAFTAGWAATLMSGGHQPEALGCRLRMSPSQMLRVP